MKGTVEGTLFTQMGRGTKGAGPQGQSPRHAGSTEGAQCLPDSQGLVLPQREAEAQRLLAWGKTQIAPGQPFKGMCNIANILTLFAHSYISHNEPFNYDV